MNEETVLDALSQVSDPVLNRDLVALGAIRDLRLNGGQVEFRLVLSTPAHPARHALQSEARRVVADLPEVTDVIVHLDAEVPSDGRTRGLADKPIKNAVAVASGKGGVGKTTVAVNVAVALAQSGASVGLLDADVYGPNVPTMLGLERMPAPREKKMVPAEAYGVRVMSIAFLVKPGQPLIWRGPMLHSAIRQFVSDVDWGELDYLIVDLPPGTGDAPLSLAQSMPLSGAIIVTLPQAVSLEDARRGLEMFRSMDVPVLGVIENMSFLMLEDGTTVDVFGQGGGEALAAEAGVPFLGAVPMDPNVRRASDSGVPVVVSHPDSAAGQALVSVAEDVSVRVSLHALEAEGGIPIEIVD